MENVEKIAEDLYFVKDIRPEGRVVGITVVLGNQKIGVIDTGYEETINNYLFPFLHEVGRSPDEIDLVVITHRDRDHIGGTKIIQQNTKAKIAIHELDAEAVEGVDIELKNGDRVKLGDREFEVIHAPGHTPGNTYLYQKEEQLLIVGDTLCGDRVNLIRMNKDIYINSIKKMLELDVKTLIQSHPRNPIAKVILIGEEARQMMRASITLAEQAE